MSAWPHQVCLDDSRGEYWHLRSGEMFDYRLFNLFGIYIGGPVYLYAMPSGVWSCAGGCLVP